MGVSAARSHDEHGLSCYELARCTAAFGGASFERTSNRLQEGMSFCMADIFCA